MKSNQTHLRIGILLVSIAIGIGIVVISNTPKSNSSESYGSTKTTEISINSNNSSNSSSSQNFNTSSAASSKVTVESGYTVYDSKKLENAKYGKVILFFHATWCPSCKALDTDIKKNLANIPNDTLILKVDYDSNPDLKSKYKITSQHTLVQVNENGDLIKTSPGLYQLNTLDSVLKNF